MIQSDELDTLSIETEDEIIWVEVNRPDKLNALNDRVLTELENLFEAIAKEDSLRGVIIRGTGEKAFVAGADIKELKDLNRRTGEDSSRKGQKIFQSIEDMPIPVVGAINGYALGGGAELAMACHLRIASEKAVFGLPEVGLGLIPGYGGTQRLPKLVGRTMALEMILTGEPIQADEALDCGLVNRVVPHSDLESEARGLMNAITNNAPLAIKKALRSVLKGDELGPKQRYEHESDLFGELCETKDATEGLSAFLEKRNPEFKGE